MLENECKIQRTLLYTIDNIRIRCNDDIRWISNCGSENIEEKQSVRNVIEYLLPGVSAPPTFE